MSVCWKATRPDGTDFHTGRIDYANAVGGVLDPGMTGKGSMPGPGWLHLATAPTACAGMRWPCRLFEVEPVGVVITTPNHPDKVGCTAVRVLREVPAHLALGPQGREVAALIKQARGMTAAEVDAWDAAWAAARDAARAAARDAARDAAWDAARDAAWAAARDAAWAAAWDAAWAAARDAAWAAAWDAAWDAAWAAAWAAAWDAAWDAARALVVRDLIPADVYRALVGPWASVMGWPHPDDDEAADAVLAIDRALGVTDD